MIQRPNDKCTKGSAVVDHKSKAKKISKSKEDQKLKKEGSCPLKTRRKNEPSMPQIFPDVAGIDIGASAIYVAIPKDGSVEVTRFGTTTPQLHKLADYLKAAHITSAAMEATGVYWVPLFEILEDRHLAPFLVDAKSVKNVPGRKTDVIDCQWIQRLFACGLLRPAFRPAKEREAFRAYFRHRDSLIRERQKFLLRINKSLQLMNIKLDLVVTEMAGVTGLKIIRAIVKGERDPYQLALLRNHRCLCTEAEFVEALTGNYQETHLFSLKQNLEMYDSLGEKMRECDEKIEAELATWKIVTEDHPPVCDKDKHAMHPCYRAAKKPTKNRLSIDMRTTLYQRCGVDLMAIPGISEYTAAVIISELGGTDLSAFPTEKHFSSWCGLAPGNNISGGKNLGGRSKKCRNRIKMALCMAAMSLCSSKTALGAHYRRLAFRLGDKRKAIKASAHKLAIIVYQMLVHGSKYVERGQEYYENQQAQKRLKNLLKNAQDLGYQLVPVQKAS